VGRRIRWLGIGMTACFVVLFLQLNNLQVAKAHQYSTAPDNPQVIEAQRSQPRGAILSADGVVLAKSVPAPPSDYYKYQRVYPTGSLFGQITGYFSHEYGIEDGVEKTYNSYLLSHNRPVKTIRDLLTTTVEVDNVTLTLSNKLQTDAQQVLAGRNGAVVVLNPSTGAIEAMYSNPSFDPTPLAKTSCAVSVKVGKQTKCTQTVAEQAWKTYTTNDPHGFNPLTSLAYQNIFPPGSTFKTVTTSAAYEHAPLLVGAPMPYYVCIPGGTLQGQAPNKPLCNDSGSGCGGTIAQMLPPSCDTGYAILGTKIGAQSMTAEAEAYGFNQQPPIDLPGSHYEISQFLQPSTCSSVSAQIFLAFSSIGQDCTIASPLQMAMVAAAIANNGVLMTPHVMAEIRDSQDKVVASYKPKVWKRPISPQTAAAINKLMQQVVTNGTASSVGFLPLDDVAAKTGTAQVGVGNTATTDWMIAFAPASAPKVAVAVMIPNQALSAYGATVAGPIVNTMIQDALASP
jgi:peptidoglycan glycosyltransferase